MKPAKEFRQPDDSMETLAAIFCAAILAAIAISIVAAWWIS